MISMPIDEVGYRFTPRQRPFEDDPRWEKFLEDFSCQYPEFDSYRNAFFLLENGIGDQVCVLGLLRAFRQHFRAKNIIILANKRSRDLLSLFDSYDYVVDAESVPEFVSTSSGRAFNVLHRPSKSFSNYGRLGPVFNAYAIPYIDQYKIGMGLPLPVSFDPPNIQLPQASSDIHSLVPPNAIILFPFSNTWRSPPVEFWERLASRLNKAGFEVFTNTVNKTASTTSRQPNSRFSNFEPLANTSALECSLKDLILSANGAAGLVMNVSGPAWLLAHSRSRKTVLYEDCGLPASQVRTASAGEILSIFDIERLSSNFPEEVFNEVVLDYSEDTFWDRKINDIVAEFTQEK